MKHLNFHHFSMGNDLPFVLVAGPCAIESQTHAMMMAEKLKTLTQKYGVPLIYKSSFDKANRSSVNSNRGVGIDEGLKILQEVKNTFDIPVLTDVHNEQQCDVVSSVVDVLQIPAFLCRQTDLLRAAAKTNKVINIKKGQFLAPHNMDNIVKKMETFGNDTVILCDRGTCFGYNALISDFKGLEVMKKTSYPVMFDAGHSVQQPGGGGDVTSGERHHIPLLIRAALSVGVASIFIETHDDPNSAPSDASTMLPFDYLPHILPHMVQLDHMTKEHLKNLPLMSEIYHETSHS